MQRQNPRTNEIATCLQDKRDAARNRRESSQKKFPSRESTPSLGRDSIFLARGSIRGEKRPQCRGEPVNDTFPCFISLPFASRAETRATARVNLSAEQGTRETRTRATETSWLGVERDRDEKKERSRDRREREIDRTRVRNSLGTIVCAVGSSVEFHRRYAPRRLMLCAFASASPSGGRSIAAGPRIFVPRFPRWPTGISYSPTHGVNCRSVARGPTIEGSTDDRRGSSR